MPRVNAGLAKCASRDAKRRARIRHAILTMMTSLAMLTPGLVLLVSGGAMAQQARPQPDVKADDELETKNIFGFTSGTDIGPEHDLELELETNLEFKKRSGAYNSGDQFVTLEYNPTDWIEADSRVRVSFDQIKGVDGLDDNRGANFGGLAAKYSFVLIHRAPATPVALTVSVEPEWSRVDEVGHTDSAFSAETRIIVDTELVPGTLYAAANAIYQPLESRNFGAPAWIPSTNFGVAAALAYRLDPSLAKGMKQVVLGAELEYYRGHDTLGFTSFSGDSLSFGPTLYLHFNDTLFVEAAISTQIAGRAVGDPNPLDLVHFSRNKAQVTIGIDF